MGPHIISEFMAGKFIVLFLVLGGSVAYGQYNHYKHGVDAYQKESYQEAITSLGEFLTKPNRQKNLDPDAHYVRALSFYKLKRYHEAIPDFDEAIRLGHPNRGNLHWFKARCYSEDGFPAKSIGEYKEALELLPSPKDQVSLLLERSREYRKLSDTPAAIADLNTALAMAPGNESVKTELESYSINEITPSSAVVLPVVPAGQPLPSALRDAYKMEKRYALVIGNSTYKHVPALRNPVNDASDVAGQLRQLDFDVINLDDATYGEMRNAFFKFHEKLVNGPKDQTVGLFYFAGHGLQSEGENYLVPVDANIEYEDDIARQCFPVQKIVLGNMERSNSRMNILILDACRNNPFPGTSRTVTGGLTEMRKARGSFIAYATAPGSTASDGVGRNGLYTQELLRALQKSGLTLEQVFKEVRVNVLRLSGEKQSTWDNSNITGEFYFNFN